MKKWVVSFGGTGLVPAMPGTFASLAAAVIFYALWRALQADVRYVIAPLIAVAAVVGLWLSAWAQEYFKRGDPRPFVLDEVVGQWLVLLLIPLGDGAPANMAAGFFLFRAFDVTKPFPINRIEAIPGGWGILLDDVAAALYSGAVFWGLLYAIRAVTAI